MTSDRRIAEILREAANPRRNDDLERAEALFRGHSPEYMAQSHGWETHQEYLDRLRLQRKERIDAANYLDAMLRSNGL